LKYLGKYSGILLNKLKTEGLWLGNLKTCIIQIGGINSSDKPVRDFVVFFGHDIEKCKLENNNRPMQRYHLQLGGKKVNNVWKDLF